jgi:hypothetical protein
MPDLKFPVITEALSPRKQEQFKDAVFNLRTAIDAGEMANARFLEAKDTISRTLRYAWSEGVQKPFRWNKEYNDAASEKELAALREFSGDPQVNTIKKMKRQAAAVGKTDAGLAITAMLEEAGSVLQMVVDGKAIAVKKTAAPKKVSATEKYQSPDASRSVMADVLKELTHITEEARQGIAATIGKRHTQLIERFLKAQTAHYEEPVDDRPARFDPYTYARALGRGTADGPLMASIRLVVIGQMSEGCHKFLPRDNPEEIISKQAAEDADMICRSFIEKNLVKLAPIVEGKGNYDGLKVLGRNVDPSQMEGRLRISFDDGSSFEARTQAVMSFSEYGTAFMRYPLTFHDVEMPDGSSMKRPSEKKMNEDFAQIDFEAAADPSP